MVTARHSYKQRFRSTRTVLQIVVQEKEKLEEDQAILVRAQVYKNLLAGKSLAVYGPFGLLKSLNRTPRSLVARTQSLHAPYSTSRIDCFAIAD